SDPMGCKRSIAYIPDDPQLYEYLTGIQYLDFIADIFGVSSADRSLRVREYADAFELTPSLGDLISGYSHGMKQKLAVISALIHEPQLLILDEPFVGLDPKAASVLKKLMRSVAERGGAVFFSTHVLEVAEKLCDKVAMIKQGRLLASGSMSDILGGGSLEDVFMEALDDKTDDNAH
ncbi:MAG: ABC transporter ATP-binding protein, partial [Ruminococcus sp.]|nr:ABC transporter ATP-binding protein [Ruminococcus sp.]